MDFDPDIAIPSIEASTSVKARATGATTPHSDKHRNGNVSRATTMSAPRLDSSPVRTPFKTPRSRASTPGSTGISRSPSVASLRNERSTTPKLDKKRSIPNLSAHSSTPPQPQFRRASSNLNPRTPLKGKAMDRPISTPASVARDYFGRDLQAHARTGSEVVVLTHDACYGHRFARPRSTKAALNSIVERPERIHATLLGASAAYVRLGSRHRDGKNAPHPDRDAGTPPFAFVKSTRSIPLNNPAVTAVHGTKWMESLQVMCDSAEAKLAMGQKELARPIGHTRDSKGSALPALHSGDLYLSSESLAALQGCLGGVCDAVDLVFPPESTTQRAFVCIRPPGHHCSADMPSGFCWLNNVHVGITYAAMNHGLTHAAIIDFDLHHGDGSQTITWDHNQNAHSTLNLKNVPAHKKTPIGYYSLHDINSYPCEYGDEDKVRNASTCLHMAHGQSIWNVHLEPWKSPADFWESYETKYKVLLDKAKSFLLHHSQELRKAGVQPKAAIFLSSGFDASEWESEFMQRHQVNVPTDFYARITSEIVAMSNEANLGVDGRMISVLEGGYSDRALTSGVMSHLCGLTSGSAKTSSETLHPGLSAIATNQASAGSEIYDSLWWQQDELEYLEAVVSGRTPKAPKSQDKLPSSYSSPTHASKAKMTEVAKERTSLSAQIEARLWLENAPPEPVPDVDWATAAYELSRLLIPSDRPVKSCTHEELNAENSRARKDRQSLAPTSDVIEDKMQLRDRKPKQTNLGAARPQAASRTSSRRTTIAAASELPDSSIREPPRSRRRSSAASSVLSGFHELKLDDNDGTIDPRISSGASMAVSAKPDTDLSTKRTRAPARKPTSVNNSPRKPRSSAAPSAARLGTVNELLGASTDQVPAAQGDGMDDLTNVMKKISIKLKMPTEEEHNVNLKRGEGANAATTKPVRKAPVPKATKAKNTPATQSSTVSTQGPSSALPLQAAVLSSPGNAQATPLLNSSLSDVTATPIVPVQQSIDTLDEREVEPQHTNMQSASGLNSVSTARTQQESTDLHDAPSPESGGLPQEPAPTYEHAQTAVKDDISYPSILLNSGTSSFEVNNERAEQDSKSFWDVPETPQR